ncbi:MAG: hypothetical protein K8T89_06515 [Planctomycetes bacterium]|nr:hypothetical protein [Planctomycetota bacterium]
MSLPMGRRKALSGMRRFITDICRAAQGVPSVMIERQMSLHDVVAARQLLKPHVQWTSIFAKAFALTSLESPALLLSYVRFPWPHFYEHQTPIVNITIERQHKGEEAVFFAQVRHPNLLPLAEIDQYLRRCKSEPVETIGSFRRGLVMARLPGLLRRLAVWSAFHGSGRWRERYIGTFSVTSTASLGSGPIRVISPMTSTLHYGLFDAQNRLDMRMTFDHRVLDGGTAARALAIMEKHLQGSILNELRSMAATRMAA